MGRPVRIGGARASYPRRFGPGDGKLSRRVLVTGGTGFIGREAVAALEGYGVHLLSRSGEAPAGTTGHAFDLLAADPTRLLEQVAPSHLLHLAWHVPPGGFWIAPENLDWVAASLRLVRAFSAAGGKRAVLAGTCAEYDWNTDLLDEATTPLRPHTLYGEAKASLFRLVTAASPALGLSVAWGRIFFPYGPLEKPGRLFSSVVDGIRAGKFVPCSAGTQIRDFMHVADYGRAFAALLASNVEGPVNIASGEGETVRAFTEQAAAHAGDASLLRIGARPIQPGEPPVMRAAVARLRDEVGCMPSLGFAEGIARAVADRPQGMIL